MTNEHIESLKRSMDDTYNTMPDNTQINNDEKQLRIAKLNIPITVVDFLMEHYGFFDLVELNTLSLHVLQTLGQMEKDGFKFAAVKNVDDETKAYELDIHDLIGRFRIQMAKAMSQNKEKNEKNRM